MAKIAIGIVMLLAISFVIWKFADFNPDDPEAVKRSNKIIAMYDSVYLGYAKISFDKFWAANRAMGDKISGNRVGAKEYERFVKTRFPGYEEWRAMLASLQELSRLYDSVYDCQVDNTCSTSVLREFYCPLAAEHNRIYQPFYSVIYEKTKLSSGANLLKVSNQCQVGDA